VALGCSTLYLLASSCLSSSLIRSVIPNRLRPLLDLDRFGCVEVSRCRFRFCPDEDDDRGCWLISSPLKKPLVPDWLSLNELPVTDHNVSGSPNSIP
jgi:hypothetical protein